MVNSFATDILQPPIGLLIGSQLVNSYVILKYPVNVSADSLHTPHDVAAAGGVTWNYGNFLQTLLNLLIIGLVLFGIVKMYIWIGKAFKKKNAAEAAAVAPPTAACPQCLEQVNVLANRCKSCTSWLAPEGEMTKAFSDARDAERAKQAAILAAAAAAASLNDDEDEFPASRHRYRQEKAGKESLLD